MRAPKVFIRHVVIGLSLALQPFVAHSAASQTWPQPPSQLSLDSPYGTLQVSQSDYVYAGFDVGSGPVWCMSSLSDARKSPFKKLTANDERFALAA
jgi:hypothetical protein